MERLEVAYEVFCDLTGDIVAFGAAAELEEKCAGLRVGSGEETEGFGGVVGGGDAEAGEEESAGRFGEIRGIVEPFFG